MNKSAFITTAALCLTLTSCVVADEHEEYKVDVSKLPPVSARQDVTFASDIKPLIEKSCLKCHSGRRPKAHLSMESREDLLKGGEDGKAVIVGKSEASPIIGYTSDLVEDMEMPPPKKRDEFPALTKEQIGLLRAWIDQGAK